MLAKMELIEASIPRSFTYRWCAPLCFTSRRSRRAKASWRRPPWWALAVRISYVVGFTEGDHAARADEVIEAADRAWRAEECALRPPRYDGRSPAWRLVGEDASWRAFVFWARAVRIH